MTFRDVPAILTFRAALTPRAVLKFRSVGVCSAGAGPWFPGPPAVSEPAGAPPGRHSHPEDVERLRGSTLVHQPQTLPHTLSGQQCHIVLRCDAISVRLSESFSAYGGAINWKQLSRRLSCRTKEKKGEMPLRRKTNFSGEQKMCLRLKMVSCALLLSANMAILVSSERSHFTLLSDANIYA